MCEHHPYFIGAVDRPAVSDLEEVVVQVVPRPVHVHPSLDKHLLPVLVEVLPTGSSAHILCYAVRYVVEEPVEEETLATLVDAAIEVEERAS